jgi:hypothetical protein
MLRQYNKETVLLFSFFISAEVRRGELGRTGKEVATFQRKAAGLSTWYKQ